MKRQMLKRNSTKFKVGWTATQRHRLPNIKDNRNLWKMFSIPLWPKFINLQEDNQKDSLDNKTLKVKAQQDPK
jgi:hypothetical protein